MPQPEFPRGAILARAARFAVAWGTVGDALVLIPIEWPEPRLAGDVPIGPELVLFEGGVIRTSQPCRSRSHGQEHQATLPPALVSRVSLAIARLSAERRHAAIWDAVRSQKADRESSCVCL